MPMIAPLESLPLVLLLELGALAADVAAAPWAEVVLAALAVAKAVDGEVKGFVPGAATKVVVEVEAKRGVLGGGTGGVAAVVGGNVADVAKGVLLVKDVTVPDV